ncbi:phenylalanyl-tRNA synthetase [Conidiobolus coronatus NRRL 28638]|uniref:phenylalanine--tRNA ligase n=1 Tax=Conidiobolus coronatus (strain ATCC 28846 / CBS 209.66 / NRRL 28638) TaxID=796925 RepID=A0A137P487_CONC2|nr:phenylalanyl-tRNA synthetase [Conidiobolus coronatus NRRL 28638]|eukprot:KXN69816.1 phenylalanyl-tRNA synthetase [Conidiobolus coronatus NRRL 28638]
MIRVGSNTIKLVLNRNINLLKVNQYRQFTNNVQLLKKFEPITYNGVTYPADNYTNVTPSILSRLDFKLHNQKGHPIQQLKERIEALMPGFKGYSDFPAIVGVEDNFDHLLFPADHPGRNPSDSFYLNKSTMLRTHTSANEKQVLENMSENKFLITADVYRRDEIDSSHYPAFHQMEANLSKNNPIQDGHDPEQVQLLSNHLKMSLNNMLQGLFYQEKDLKIRWIEAYFPFTSPSWEVEVWYQEKWLEVLGCGILQQPILNSSNRPDEMEWAFGLGLERLAMVMHSIPDIRLFWSQDPRFLTQFENAKPTDPIIKFQQFSKHPPCTKDLSFWISKPFEENTLCDIVREVAGDLVETVSKIDHFVHPKTKKESMCYRIIYRSMDRTVTNEEINQLQEKLRLKVKEELEVELR